MRHPDPLIQAAREKAAWDRYEASVKSLGVTLKKVFPEIPFTYDEPSKMWLTEDPVGIETLLDRFDFYFTDYLPNWKKFLGIPALVVQGHDCVDWFGFTIE